MTKRGKTGHSDDINRAIFARVNGRRGSHAAVNEDGVIIGHFLSKKAAEDWAGKNGYFYKRITPEKGTAKNEVA